MKTDIQKSQDDLIADRYRHHERELKKLRSAPNKAQHSPLPWQMINGAVFDDNAHMVYSSQIENAELIVRAVNHADKLAEALKDIETRSSYALIRPDKTNNDIQMDYIKQKASNALAAYKAAQ